MYWCILTRLWENGLALRQSMVRKRCIWPKSKDTQQDTSSPHLSACVRFLALLLSSSFLPVHILRGCNDDSTSGVLATHLKTRIVFLALGICLPQSWDLWTSEERSSIRELSVSLQASQNKRTNTKNTSVKHSLHSCRQKEQSKKGKREEGREEKWG